MRTAPRPAVRRCPNARVSPSDLAPRLAASPDLAALDAATLDALAREAGVTSHAPGETVLAAGEAGRFLVLLDGRIRVGGGIDEDGDARLGPGDALPLAALLAHRGAASAHVAIDAVRVAGWPAATFARLAHGSSAFAAACAARVEARAREALERLRERRAAPADALLATPLAALALREPVVSPLDAPLGDALRRMQAGRVGSVIGIDADGRPAAILTLRDVLERVALGGAALQAPLRTVASPLRWTAPSTAPALHAAALMARHGVRHVAVVDDGVLLGVVSESRLHALQHGGLHRVAARIRGAADGEALARAAGDARALAATLADQGGDALELVRLVSSLNDAIASRALALAAAVHPPPAVRWCWLALGSEGREEQTLATDQDNALVFEAGDGEDPDALRAAFLPFAGEANRLLDAAGVPLCRGGIMAGRPDCCLSLHEWRGRFASWLDRPEPRPLLNAAIFFDFRAVEGDASLAQALRAWLADAVGDDARVLVPMTLNALDNAPPLGLVRDFVLASGGEHPGTIDLKVNGVQPFVEAARILALAAGSSATSTVDRLRDAGRRRGLPPLEVQGWVEAFRALQSLRLRLNAAQWRAGEPPHNHLDPATLDGFERRMLKEALRQARRLQQRLAREHGGAPVALR